MYTIGRK